MERVRAHHEPDPDPLRRLRPRGEREPALVVGAGRVADDGVDVIPGPERVVAQLVGTDAGLEELRPGCVLVPAERADLDLSHAMTLPVRAAAGAVRSATVP